MFPNVLTTLTEPFDRVDWWRISSHMFHTHHGKISEIHFVEQLYIYLFCKNFSTTSMGQPRVYSFVQCLGSLFAQVFSWHLHKRKGKVPPANQQHLAGLCFSSHLHWRTSFGKLWELKIFQVGEVSRLGTTWSDQVYRPNSPKKCKNTSDLSNILLCWHPSCLSLRYASLLPSLLWIMNICERVSSEILMIL